MFRPHRRLSAALVATGLALTAMTLAACGSEQNPADRKVVTLATHDSWAMNEEVLAQFREETGLTVKVLPQGDAGALTNKLVLTKDNPVADAVYGIDNAFASRALDEGVLAEYAVPGTDAAYAVAGGEERLTPIDYSDVCVNVDDRWFAKRGKPAPRTLDDLTKTAYRGLFVTPGATSSSPGLAFLLATVAAKGEGWPDYWRALVANDVKITAGWSDAYEVDFTAGGGSGDRPLVLSYASSPPFTVPEGGGPPRTSALLDTCFRQVEYAGVLAGAENATGAEKLVRFLTESAFQEALPEQMYVFPATQGTPLPPEWARWAKVAPRPYSMPATEIAAKRADWLREWRDLTSR